MAPQKDSLGEYPQEVRGGTQRASVVYTRLPDHYAVRRRQSDADGLSEDVVAAMAEGEDEIQVFRGEAGARRRGGAAGEISPVYALQPGGTPAVPTGQVFIRLAEGVAVGERKREIEQAGYEIAQSLDYAPNAAWLRARSGRIADGLTGVEALEKIEGVENVEPQMLTQRAKR